MTAIAGRAAGEGELVVEPPPLGEIVRRVSAWLDPDHPYAVLFDISDASADFVRECADEIGRLGEFALFSGKQLAYLRSIWREVTQQIRQAQDKKGATA